MINRNKNKGFSLVELMIVSLAGTLILLLLYQVNTVSLKMFTKVKNVSDNLETQVPAMDFMQRYFERWGVGVLADNQPETLEGSETSDNIIDYPLPTPRTIRYVKASGGNPCDSVEFYGNLGGYGFVQSVSGGSADIIGCNIAEEHLSNCFQFLRAGVISPPFGDNSYTSVDEFRDDFIINQQNISCSQHEQLYNSSTKNFTPNYRVNRTLFPDLQPGDLLMNAPKKIRFECKKDHEYEFEDGAKKNYKGWWLYVRTEPVNFGSNTCLSGEIDGNWEPIAAVNAFNIKAADNSALAPDSNGLITNELTSVKVEITFREESSEKNTNKAVIADEENTFSRIYGVQ